MGVEGRYAYLLTREYETPTITDERVPSKKELEKILRMAAPNWKVMRIKVLKYLLSEIPNLAVRKNNRRC